MVWTQTSIPGVEIAWDAEAREARVSHRYETDEAGNPLVPLDYDEVLYAAEAALDAQGVHVLLEQVTAEAGEADAQGRAEEVLFYRPDEEWVPTHRIVFRKGFGAEGAPETTLVMLVDDVDGVATAYDRDEWRAGEGGAWYLAPDDSGRMGWYCHGEVTPGGQVGTVTVSKIK